MSYEKFRKLGSPLSLSQGVTSPQHSSRTGSGLFRGSQPARGREKYTTENKRDKTEFTVTTMWKIDLKKY